MANFLKRRRTIKKEVVEQVKADKAEQKQVKKEIAELPKEQQKSAMDEYKKEKKAKKQQKKAELRQMSRKERRAEKKRLKMYKKVKNRPIRATFWGALALVILLIAVQVGPTVYTVVGLLTARDIQIDTTSDEAVAMRELGDSVSEEIANEGMILLKNDDQALPLQQKEVNVFGINSIDFSYSGGGSGTADISRASSVYKGLEQAGLQYNQELYEVYQQEAEELGIEQTNSAGLMQIAAGFLSSDEDVVLNHDYLTRDVLDQAKAYSNHALIFINSEGSEASDMSIEQLQVSDYKRELIDIVANEFEQVTLVINAGNTLELGFVDEYESINSILWVGIPGPYGTKSIGNILAGNINPSGKLTDTMPYDNTTAPGTVNFGDFKYDDVKFSFLNYQEGIYVGYRYYETYFQDDEEGYEEAIMFPFGHGLSYTDFEWDVVNEEFSDETITVEVEVTNTGEVEGKEVVQLYYSPPYYEGGIEKSAISLGGFEKTSLLQPGESEALTISFDTREMASYDMEQESYILEAGDYEIQVSRNVHEPVNVSTYTLDEDTFITENTVTGTEYENRFDFAEGDFSYLSRSDWESTYPSINDAAFTAPDVLIETLNSSVTEADTGVPTFEAENDLMLEELKGAAFDDPRWDEYLDQFTLDEMIKLVANGAYKTIAIDRLGVPNSVLLDGPAGLSYFFKKTEAAAYPSEIVLGSSWNRDLAYKMGESVGKEAKAYGVHGWYAPGMNIHRTPQGGRNFEYFSEDPLLSGHMGASITKGAQDQDIIVFMKHFALNDQETNARSGNVIWANEQTIREIYLKPFEITVKDGGALGAMSSFAMIGGQWSGANAALLQDILRDEWGFEGMVSSDAVFGFMDVPQAVVAGNDLMLDTLTPKAQEDKLKAAYEEYPASISQALRMNTKRVLYTLLQTHLVD